MQAVCIHHCEGLEDEAIEEMDRPIPAANEVLIKVFAASVNPVDAKMREGKYLSSLGRICPVCPAAT